MIWDDDISFEGFSKKINDWYDGKDFVPYKYTNIIFLKFVKEEKEINLEDITLD